MSKRAFPKKLFMDEGMVIEGTYFTIDNDRDLDEVADECDLPLTLAEYQLVRTVTIDRTITMKTVKGKK